MIFDLLGAFLEPPGKWSPGARDGALELLATIFKELLYFRLPGNLFGRTWSPGARNGALELEMKPWISKWSPGPRTGALDFGISFLG